MKLYERISIKTRNILLLTCILNDKCLQMSQTNKRLIAINKTRIKIQINECKNLIQ